MPAKPKDHPSILREQALLEHELLERQAAAARLKHFVSRFTPDFRPGWHIDEICAAVERLEQEIQRGAGTDARLIVEAPPRHTKSQTISKCTPLWYLGRHPNHEIIVATYNQDLADDIGRWAKQMVQDPAFKAVFPNLQIRKDSKAANRLETTKGGAIRYVGVGGSLTGRGGHLIIVDDPIKGAEDADSEVQSTALWDWYTSVLRTRLAPGGAICVLHTRWRLNDLIGRLLRAQSEGNGENWRRLTFRALAEDDDQWRRAVGEPLQRNRFSAEDLKALRKALPDRDWLALYQQRPMAEEGNIFKVDHFQLYKPAHRPKNLSWHIAGDGAFSTKSHADYSCLWPYGVDPDGEVWFSPNFVHGRMDVAEFVDHLFRLIREHGATTFTCEAGAHWRAIEPLIKARMRKERLYFQVHTPAAVQDKFTRSRAIHARMIQGVVHYPDTRYVRERVIPEFLVFTGKNDEHDDIVDTCAWAGHALEKIIPPPSRGAAEDEELIDPGEWTMADIDRRSREREAPAPRHVPESLFGGRRRGGADYCRV